MCHCSGQGRTRSVRQTGREKGAMYGGLGEGGWGGALCQQLVGD